MTGWRPVKPPAMPEATFSVLQANRKPGLRLGHVTSRRVERDSPADPHSAPRVSHESHPLSLAHCDQAQCPFFCFFFFSLLSCSIGTR